jgi:hypothetical protein
MCAFLTTRYFFGDGTRPRTGVDPVPLTGVAQASVYLSGALLAHSYRIKPKTDAVNHKPLAKSKTSMTSTTFPTFQQSSRDFH